MKNYFQIDQIRTYFKINEPSSYITIAFINQKKKNKYIKFFIRTTDIIRFLDFYKQKKNGNKK